MTDTRVMYEPTEKQIAQWEKKKFSDLPTDEEFKADWARKHGGKLAGWGLAKRKFMLGQLQCCMEYSIGLWQGRVDKARGLAYQHEAPSDDNINAYNHGYHNGYCSYESNRGGWDAGTKQRFDEKYLNDLG